MNLSNKLIRPLLAMRISPTYASLRFYSSEKKTDSKKKIGKFGAAVEKITLPVEEDAHRLVKYVCGTNLLKEGGEDVQIKPDSEYPEWLWTIRTGKPLTLDELDPNSIEYWQTVRTLGRRKKNQLKKIRKF